MQRQWSAAWACLWVVACGACSLPAAQKGDTCERSAQCAAGLACVEHECTKDLSSVADQSTVPDFGGPDASLDAAALGDGGQPSDSAASDDAG